MPTLPKIITRTLSLKLSLMAVCEISLLLMVALAVMFHYSRKVLKEEAMIDAEHTLDGTAQHIDNVLLSVEQSAGNIYFDLLKHLDEPERMYDYSRHLVESNPYIVGCAIVFKPHYYPGKELFMAYVRRKGYSLTAEYGTRHTGHLYRTSLYRTGVVHETHEKRSPLLDISVEERRCRGRAFSQFLSAYP